jgi:hypothetical protein
MRRLGYLVASAALVGALVASGPAEAQFRGGFGGGGFGGGGLGGGGFRGFGGGGFGGWGGGWRGGMFAGRSMAPGFGWGGNRWDQNRGWGWAGNRWGWNRGWGWRRGWGWGGWWPGYATGVGLGLAATYPWWGYPYYCSF